MDVPKVHSNESVTYLSSEAEESTDATESSSCYEEMKPISSFISNRRKMLEVAFSSVNADKLKAIIPPFLKDTMLDELKLICYEELCCLTDDALKSILEDNNWDDLSSTEFNKTTSSMEICSHEPRTVCGFEVCKSEDTTTSIDSKNKDILEIGISEEEVCHLLKEIPNSQHTSKDTLAMSTSSPSVTSTSGIKCFVSDDVPIIHGDSLHILEVEPQYDLLELFELEHRARSIRSLIMQCDTERENVSEISDKSTEIHSREHTNKKCSNLDGISVTQKQQQLDHLFYVCSPASKLALTSCKKRTKNLNCENKLKMCERVGHSAMLVSSDYKVMETQIPENNSIVMAHGNVKSGDQSDGYHTRTLDSPCNYNSTEVESVCNNTNQLQITISALNDDTLSTRDLQTSSHSVEKLKEKNIHKVVETSKMCTKLRERIKRTQKLKKFKDDNIKANTVILGTVEEYKSLNTK